MKKIIILLALILILSGCFKSKNTDFVGAGEESSFKVPLNKYLCLKESGTVSGDSTFIRTKSQRFIDFLARPDYSALKPQLTSSLQSNLESLGIQQKGLGVFFQGADKILPEVKSYNIEVVYLLKTNPQSTEVTGMCQASTEDVSKNVFFSMKPQELELSEKMAAVLITGLKGRKRINVGLLLDKIGDDWKISYISIYPGALGNKTSYDLYLIANQAMTSNKLDAAFIFYKALTSISPKNAVLPQYIYEAHSAMDKIDRESITLPQKDKEIKKEWEVTPEKKLTMVDARIIPLTDKLTILLSYNVPEMTRKAVRDNALEILEYFKKNYPDITQNFETVVIEGIPPGGESGHPQQTIKIMLNLHTANNLPIPEDEMPQKVNMPVNAVNGENTVNQPEDSNASVE